MLSSLTVDCSQLDKVDAEHIQRTITELRVGLIELRMRLADRTQVLQQQAQPTSGTEDQQIDLQQPCSDLQKWFDDTRKMTVTQQADVSTDSLHDSEVCHQFLSHFMQTVVKYWC